MNSKTFLVVETYTQVTITCHKNHKTDAFQ